MTSGHGPGATDYGKPVPWVIVIEAMDYEKACEIGRLLGANGVTGRFLSGTVASNLNDYARLKSSQKRKETEPRDEGK